MANSGASMAEFFRPETAPHRQGSSGRLNCWSRPAAEFGRDSSAEFLPTSRARFSRGPASQLSMQRSVPLAPDTPLGFLASRIDYERTAMPYSPDALRLDRMRQLLARLGNPEQALRDRPHRRHEGKGFDGGHDRQRAAGRRLSGRAVQLAPSRPRRRAHGDRRPAMSRPTNWPA